MNGTTLPADAAIGLGERCPFGRAAATEASLIWYVGYTRAKIEIETAERLTQDGFGVFLPMVKRRRRIRFRRSRNYEWTTVEQPLFPRYLFVGIEPGRNRWAAAKAEESSTSLGILTNEGIPLRVPFKTIDGLRVAQDMGLFDDRGSSAPPFKPGDAVHIEEGPLGGFDAKVLRMAKRRRATVEIDGMSRPVEVPIEILRLLGAVA